ncbi:hypothetical protein AB0L85_15015 [Streptomyces sp. NPDC052051]|uniref:hypothetical protein n=1 Tax=Streptomyces sp. NPDC052051 TaxID=3154649 RepID=UPI00341821DC
MAPDHVGDEDAGTSRFLASLQALTIAASAQGSDAQQIREEAVAAVHEWADLPGKEAPTVDISHILRGVTPGDRALLAEAVGVFAEWIREPGEESGRRVDAMVQRLQRELGPLIVRDREAEKAAERERLRGEVRESIRIRLREAGVVGTQDNSRDGNAE